MIAYLPGSTQSIQSGVNHIGSLRQTIREGNTERKIEIDTLRRKTNLFGLGPMEHLKGEIMILDGKPYSSQIYGDSLLIYDDNFDISAPFFVFSYVEDWHPITFQSDINSMQDLDNLLDSLSNHSRYPFTFRIRGLISKATIHIFDLPDGVRISNHDEAKSYKKFFDLENQEVEILGYFSREHQSVFTHHDSFTHIHLLTTDSKQMGHVDALSFKAKEVTLLFPKE